MAAFPFLGSLCFESNHPDVDKFASFSVASSLDYQILSCQESGNLGYWKRYVNLINLGGFPLAFRLEELLSSHCHVGLKGAQ